MMHSSDIPKRNPLGKESLGGIKTQTDNIEVHPMQTGNESGYFTKPTLNRIQWRALA
jgi:hypothetical protein